MELAGTIIEEQSKKHKDTILIPTEIIPTILEFLTTKMTMQKQDPNIQSACVRVLTALSYQHCEAVCDAVLKYFQTGRLPSYYVLKCLADIAKCNPIEFTSRASDVFAKVTPVLGQVKKNGEIKIFTLGMFFKKYIILNDVLLGYNNIRIGTVFRSNINI